MVEGYTALTGFHISLGVFFILIYKSTLSLLINRNYLLSPFSEEEKKAEGYQLDVKSDALALSGFTLTAIVFLIGFKSQVETIFFENLLTIFLTSFSFFILSYHMTWLSGTRRIFTYLQEDLKGFGLLLILFGFTLLFGTISTKATILFSVIFAFILIMFAVNMGNDLIFFYDFKEDNEKTKH